MVIVKNMFKFQAYKNTVGSKHNNILSLCGQFYGQHEGIFTTDDFVSNTVNTIF